MVSPAASRGQIGCCCGPAMSGRPEKAPRSATKCPRRSISRGSSAAAMSPRSMIAIGAPRRSPPGSSRAAGTITASSDPPEQCLPSGAPGRCRLAGSIASGWRCSAARTSALAGSTPTAMPQKTARSTRWFTSAIIITNTRKANTPASSRSSPIGCCCPRTRSSRLPTTARGMPITAPIPISSGCSSSSRGSWCGTITRPPTTVGRAGPKTTSPQPKASGRCARRRRYPRARRA